MKESVGNERRDIMLPAQVSFWALQETKRHNEATEKLTSEQNAISKQQADAATSQAETARENAKVNAMNASTNARNAEINAFNAEVNSRNAETNAMNAVTKAREAEYNYEIGSINAAANRKNAETNRMNAYTNEGYLVLEKQQVQHKIDKLKAETSNIIATTAYTESKTIGQGEQNVILSKQAAYAGAQALGDVVNTWSSATGLNKLVSSMSSALTKIGGK